MALFNNYPYQNYGYQQPTFQQPQTNFQQTNNGVIWVTGEAGAKAYMVAPNNTVQLWDSEAPVIYVKSADASGMPSIKVLDYTIRGGEPPKENPKSEIEELKSQIAEMKNEIDELRTQIKPKKGAKKDDE